MRALCWWAPTWCMSFWREILWYTKYIMIFTRLYRIYRNPAFENITIVELPVVRVRLPRRRCQASSSTIILYPAMRLVGWCTFS